jgi:large subunit ribosomal protein L24
VNTTNPKKQRKQLYNAPLHKRYKIFSAPFSPELKKSHGTDALPLRTGDTVKIMRGERKGFEGKISAIDKAKYRVSVEGVTREKVDGTAIPLRIHPSKVMITNLNLDDKWRREILKRKGKVEEAAPSEKEEKKKKESKKEAEKKKAKKETKTPKKSAKHTEKAGEK